MNAKAQNVLRRYHYDPLDRLIGTTPVNDARLRLFYCKKRLTTEIQGAVQRTIFQQDDQLLAQHDQQDHVIESSLLATDQARSVLRVDKANRPNAVSYSPYGHRPVVDDLRSLLGFNGERVDSVTGYYLLGIGYRAFNPILMRFNSPDSFSPFGRGGFNSYVYCLGDPINRYDDSGHFPLLKMLGLKPRVKTFKILHPKKTVDLYHNNFKETKHLAPEPVISHVKDAEGLNYLQPGDRAKFVYTKDKKLIVGKLYKYDQKWHGMHHVHHGSLVANERSNKVFTAGYMYRSDGGGISISNESGHYKPTFESLFSAKKYIEESNIAKDVKLIRWAKN
ncbi:RHS repeat-associated core domain-containing protein [Pseudomonas sp. PLMAX]|uniref:RHS repeat-associated core domain-containing protein n=1 Tax=Pseudomonas sp. PLMAX TaxID=2201998 RepID=UPI0038BA8145